MLSPPLTPVHPPHPTSRSPFPLQAVTYLYKYLSGVSRAAEHLTGRRWVVCWKRGEETIKVSRSPHRKRAKLIKREMSKGRKKKSPGISLSSSCRSPKLLQLVPPPSILSHSFSTACQTSLKSLLILVTPETLILPLW